MFDGQQQPTQKRIQILKRNHQDQNEGEDLPLRSHEYVHPISFTKTSTTRNRNKSRFLPKDVTTWILYVVLLFLMIFYSIVSFQYISISNTNNEFQKETIPSFPNNDRRSFPTGVTDNTRGNSRTATSNTIATATPSSLFRMNTTNNDFLSSFLLKSSNSTRAKMKHHNVDTSQQSAQDDDKKTKGKLNDEPIHKQKNINNFPIHVRNDDDFEMIKHPLARVHELLLSSSSSFNNKNNNATHNNNNPGAYSIKVPKFWNQLNHNYPNTNNDKDFDIRHYLGNYGQRLLTKEEALSIGSYHPEGHETIFISIANYRDPECIHTLRSIYSRAQYPQRIRVAVIDQRRPDAIMTTGNDNNNNRDPKCYPIPCRRKNQNTYGYSTNTTNTSTATTNNNKEDDILCKYLYLIEYFELDSKWSVGPIFARHLGHRFYRGEYYVLQIDSHVRFVQNFDSRLIQQHRATNNEMAVLTTYLLDINGGIDPITNESTMSGRPIVCDSYFVGGNTKNQDNQEKDDDNDDDNSAFYLRYGQQPVRVPSKFALDTSQATLQPFWAAGFSFSRGHFIIQVPYDLYLPMIFQGEEISITVRGFTYGYDYYSPIENVCFHIYALYKNKENRLKVPLFYENTWDYENTLSKPKTNTSTPTNHSSSTTMINQKNNHINVDEITKQSMKRLLHIIGMIPTKNTTTADTMNTSNSRSDINTLTDKSNNEYNHYYTYEKILYGLGNIRTKEKFYETFGIDINKHQVEDNLCSFAGENMNRQFLVALRGGKKRYNDKQNDFTIANYYDQMGIDYDKIKFKFVNPIP